MTGGARLGLGTVQFGMNYGVSNRLSRPTESDVAAILARAAEAGVGYLDTAPAYGDSETLIGRHLPAGYRPRIVTKTQPIADATIEARHGKILLSSLAASLDRLRAASVYGLMVHHAGDLAKPGWQHIVDALHEAQARGLVSRVGVSVYDSDQLAMVEGRFRPRLVQLPLNALDRRAIVSGDLARLHGGEVEIHARSVFLQGLLLMTEQEIPEFFAPARVGIAALHRRWQQAGLTPLAGCIAFALQHAEISAIVVGVNRRSELDDIVAAAQSAGACDLDAPPAIDPVYLDPSRWPAFTH